MSKKEQWIDKMRSSSIVWIDDPKSSNTHPTEVATKIWDMYEHDFNLSIYDICDILLCDRNWVVKNVKDNVKHIFLGLNMRKFMANLHDNELFLKDYYYFSRGDFDRWLKDNTKIERQTIVIDLYKYSNNTKELYNIVAQYELDKYNAKSMLEVASLTAKYNSSVMMNMNNIGKHLFSIRHRVDKRTAKPIEIISGDMPHEFTSLKVLKNSLSNNERVYRSLYGAGALKYTICNSLVRFDKAYNEGVSNGLDIIIPYEEYLKL